jgi:hypothetical protein
MELIVTLFLEMPKRSKKTGVKRKSTVVTSAVLKKIKSLEEGHTKDAVVIRRPRICGYGSGTRVCCLTSSDIWTTSSLNSGLCVGVADAVRINHVEVKGRVYLLGDNVSRPLIGQQQCRILTVWFYKTLFRPVAGGQLPPVSEVLDMNTTPTGTLDYLAMIQTQQQNAGRFTVLSDKTHLLGRRPTGSTIDGFQEATGVDEVLLEYKIPVNKMMSIKVAAQGFPPHGGHFDADLDVGQVNRGLLVTYVMSEENAQYYELDIQTRLNYTM